MMHCMFISCTQYLFAVRPASLVVGAMGLDVTLPTNKRHDVVTHYEAVPTSLALFDLLDQD